MDKRRKNIMKIALIIVYVILSVSGLVLMKLGGNSGTISIANKELTFGISLISALGFICYICSFLLFTKIVMMFDLSYIVPITTGVVQILTLVASYVVFKDKMSIQSVSGAIMVIIGILIMNIKK